MNLPAGMTAAEAGIGVRIRHLLLPALTLGLTGVANITLHTREKMIAIMESDYVLFARARGESSGYIVKRHALRNLVLPAITLQFGSISEIFGGSVLVEQVFSYPGLGTLMQGWGAMCRCFWRSRSSAHCSYSSEILRQMYFTV